MISERPITAKEAAAITKQNVFTVYRQASEGKLPSYKQGNKIYFFESELLAWVKSGTRERNLVNQ
ncbi:MAG: hypothetical protein BGN92_09795 [Sphingobacteriales bacterium 41-5]|nr:MAG: hypothetical protein BGN92_09795 [Sphingobacteriales bacterium 41-5]